MLEIIINIAIFVLNILNGFEQFHLADENICNRARELRAANLHVRIYSQEPNSLYTKFQLNTVLAPDIEFK